MNPFDKYILLFLNGFVGRWPALEAILAEFQNNNVLKGALFLVPIWYLWFRPEPSPAAVLQTRKKLIAIIAAMGIGIVVARCVADFLPFRIRPAFNPELDLRTPAGIDASGLAAWSAFPSDHAVVWFTLAFGVMQLHRTLGLWCCVYACFLGVTRVFVGFHHPTDILGAAVISAGVLWMCLHAGAVMRWCAQVAQQEHLRPGLFYGAAFLATYEIANLFDEVRHMGEHAVRVLHMMRPMLEYAAAR